MEFSGSHKIIVAGNKQSDVDELTCVLSPEYNVMTAQAGPETLVVASQSPPELILLDTGMNGLETLVRLKESRELRDIPVLVITAPGGDDEERGLMLGAADYIAKPFKSSIVKARVRAHIKILRQTRAIERLALIDPLTGISNVRNFEDRAEIEWRRCVREKKPISFLLLDVDNFTRLNEENGTHLGDELLRCVAKILRATVRRPADVVARFHDDDFGVILPDTNRQNAERLAERIRSDAQALEMSAEDGDGRSARITVSIGVANVTPCELDTMKTVIDKAGENLRAAKSLGKNRVCAGDAHNPQNAAELTKI
jgi:diguanylate cyclase (GGDEF)-like protein